jgi:hypothetical protein
LPSSENDGIVQAHGREIILDTVVTGFLSLYMAVAAASQPAPIPPSETYPIVDEQYIQAPAVIYVPPVGREIAPGEAFDRKSCVSYVKARRPDLEGIWVTPKIYAQTHELKKEPWIGAVVITKESKPGTDTWHAAYVYDIASGSEFLIETNYEGEFVSTRSLPLDSQLIAGHL